MQVLNISHFCSKSVADCPSTERVGVFKDIVGLVYLAAVKDSVAVTTTAKEKTTPNFSPSPHLIGQQPFLTASPPHFTHFYRQMFPFYLFFIYLYQLSPSHYTSDVF